jgi:predicted dinucleotide-binding enzyme
MKVGIIGTGNMAGALGALFGRAGHEVLLGSREPGKATASAGKLGPWARGGTIKEAVAFGPLAVLAVPFAAAKETLAAAGPLQGRVLVDISNPLTPDFMDLTIGHSTSAGEQVAALAAGAKVVKAFNHTLAQLLQQGPELRGGRPAAFYCGDDAGAKALVAELIGSTGFDPLDVGPLSASRYLEPAAELVIRLAYAQGHGPQIALGLLRR